MSITPSTALSDKSGMAAGVNLMDGVSGDLAKGVDQIPQVGADTPWREQGPLESNTPPVRPGFDQMWVRIHTVDGKPDARNVAKKLRAGWKPRVAQPEDGQSFAVVADPTWGNLYGSGSCILFERPKELSDAARNVMRMRTSRQTMAADGEGTKDFDPMYASLSSKTKTQTKIGRDAAQLVDD